MNTDEEADRSPLLPSIGAGRVNTELRGSLRVLRETSDDAGLHERIDDVLAARTSLRELARTPEFSALVTPLAERGWRQWDNLSEDERRRLAAEAEDV